MELVPSPFLNWGKRKAFDGRPASFLLQQTFWEYLLFDTRGGQNSFRCLFKTSSRCVQYCNIQRQNNGNKANLPSIFFSLFLLYEGLRVDLLESSVWWTDFIALLHTHRRLINLTSVISLISHAPKSSMMVALPRKCWRSHSYCWSTHWSYVKLLSRKAARKWMLQVWDNIK